MAYDFDVLVLGGGPGGYEAAIRCAQYKLKTVLVEASELGGTCLNRGCIPTKALLHGAELYHSIREASVFGISVGDLKIDYQKLVAFKDTQVGKLRRGIVGLERANGVTVQKGFGKLQDAHTVSVDGKSITADKIILAVGSRPSIPPIPGAKDSGVMTSDDVLSMTEMPASLTIIGGGVIGIEFATLFSALGVNVTVIEMLPSILPGVDGELSGTVRSLLEKQGARFLTGAKVASIEGNTVHYEQDGKQSSVTSDKTVICIGRRPCTEDIGLDAVGIQTNRGYIPVDEFMRTPVGNIYAIGDITGKIQLAHVASAQGLVAAANCAGKGEAMTYDMVPACVYTNPEIAYIGLSEQACRDQGRAIRVGKFMVAGNGRSAVMNESNGVCKLVTDEKTGQILGCQILAPRATDMIAEVAAVMRSEGTIEELAATIHPHPTVSEIILEAAHDVEGLCCHAMPK